MKLERGPYQREVLGFDRCPVDVYENVLVLEKCPFWDKAL